MKTKLIEHKIVKNLDTKKGINEAWDPLLDIFDSKIKQDIRDILIKNKIDIEHTDVIRPGKITSKSEYLHDDSSVVIIKLVNDRGVAFPVVISNGVYKYDPTIFGNFNVDNSSLHIDWKSASRVGIKKLLAMANDLIVYKQNGELADQMIDLQRSRRDAKQGSVDRITDPNAKVRRGIKIDKSGYKVDPYKYENMLAELDIERYQDLITDAFNSFQYLQSKYIKNRSKKLSREINLKTVSRFSNSLGSIYGDLSRNFYSTVDDIDREYAQWKKEKEMYDYEGFSKGALMSSLKQLREIASDIKKVTNAIGKNMFES